MENDQHTVILNDKLFSAIYVYSELLLHHLERGGMGRCAKFPGKTRMLYVPMPFTRFVLKQRCIADDHLPAMSFMCSAGFILDPLFILIIKTIARAAHLGHVQHLIPLLNPQQIC